MWVWIMLGIGVIGLISMVMWAVWLWHKATDVFGELTMLGKRAEELTELLEQIQIPEPQE